MVSQRRTLQPLDRLGGHLRTGGQPLPACRTTRCAATPHYTPPPPRHLSRTIPCPRANRRWPQPARRHPGLSLSPPTLTPPPSAAAAAGPRPPPPALPLATLARTQTPDSKKEEFRKYLEKSGVIDALTKGNTNKPPTAAAAAAAAAWTSNPATAASAWPPTRRPRHPPPRPAFA